MQLSPGWVISGSVRQSCLVRPVSPTPGSFSLKVKQVFPSSVESVPFVYEPVYFTLFHSPKDLNEHTGNT